MAVVPRVATLRLDDTATHGIFRQWVATAAAENTPAGGSVNVVVNTTVEGATPPGAPTTLNLHFYRDDGTLIRTIALDTTLATQTVTFWFTSDGTSTGSPRAGMVEIAIRATRTDVVTYDVETDGTPNTPPTGNHAHTLDRGWILGTTTATVTISNVALGGGKNSPVEYKESLFVRTTLGAELYLPRSLTVNIPSTTPPLSGSTNSTSSGNFDATFANVVNERFPAAVTAVSASLAVPNATLTGLPFTVLTVSSDSINVDPRPTASLHLWQADDDVFGIPPMSKHQAAKSALVTVYSGIAMRLVGSRGTPLNGVPTTITLDPRSPGATIVRSSVTATRGGEAGWTDLAQLGAFVVGGAWDVTLAVTAADLDAPGYVLSNTDVVTILSPDSRINVMLGIGPTSSSEEDHLHAGDSMSIQMTAWSSETRRRIVPDVGTVEVMLVRWNRTLQRFEYLQSNGETWANWAGTTTTADVVTLESDSDGVTFRREIPNTGAWEAVDILSVDLSFKVNGTPYTGKVNRELTGASNSHAGYEIDPIALALSGTLSTR